MATNHFSIKSGKRGTAAAHASYITREGRHSLNGKGNDLIYVEDGNMPSWAENDLNAFWKMADHNERANGASYRELVIALPNELTMSQNIDLVRALTNSELSGKPYQFAIHAPNAALEGGSQPHVHIMFSDRILDDIDRSPEQHFKRYNSAYPEKGGAKKDSGGKPPAVINEELKSQRARLADLQNQHLKIYGHDARVDYRSHSDRGLKHKAERHLGSGAIKRMNTGEKEKYLAQRLRVS